MRQLSEKERGEGKRERVGGGRGRGGEGEILERSTSLEYYSWYFVYITRAV